MTSSSRPHALIAGAGMGGLTAALALLQRGFDCDVYEQAPELRELGAGLWISANGSRVLFSLGLEDELRDINVPPEDRVVRLWDSGRPWSVYNRDAPSGADHTLLMVLRAELHRILAQAVRRIKPDAIHFNARCAGFEADAEGVRLAFEDGSAVAGELLIGADGAHSRVRLAAFGPAPPQFTGVVAWRGLVPTERLPEHHRRPLASTWLGPTAHVTSYPVRRGKSELVSFSGQVERGDWQSESWSEEGSIEECLNDFRGWHADILQLVRNAETLYKWGIFVRPGLSTWSAGRVTLMGDACHQMVPYLGQGLNSAIEDAAILARCLDADAGDPARALRRYETARIDRVARIVRGSADMRATFHHQALGDPERALEYVGRHWHPDQVKARYDWIVGYDATRAAI